MPCQILAQSERSQLEQKNEMSPGKITGADVVPVSLLSGDFFPCFVGSATQVYCRPLSVTFFRTCNRKES